MGGQQTPPMLLARASRVLRGQLQMWPGRGCGARGVGASGASQTAAAGWGAGGGPCLPGSGGWWSAGSGGGGGGEHMGRNVMAVLAHRMRWQAQFLGRGRAREAVARPGAALKTERMFSQKTMSERLDEQRTVADVAEYVPWNCTCK